MRRLLLLFNETIFKCLKEFKPIRGFEDYRPVIIENAAVNISLNKDNIYKWRLIFFNTVLQRQSMSILNTNSIIFMANRLFNDIAESLNIECTRNKEYVESYMNSLGMLIGKYSVYTNDKDNMHPKYYLVDRDVDMIERVITNENTKYFLYIRNDYNFKISMIYRSDNENKEYTLVEMDVISMLMSDYVKKIFDYNVFGDNTLVPLYNINNVMCATIPFLINEFRYRNDAYVDKDLQNILTELNNPTSIIDGSCGPMIKFDKNIREIESITVDDHIINTHNIEDNQEQYEEYEQ